MEATGRLEIGDVAPTFAVSSAHRAYAEQRVPIWKQQAFDDGPTECLASLG